jgi:hypothetical protein
MKVLMHWSETVEYASVIEVDDEAYAEYLDAQRQSRTITDPATHQPGGIVSSPGWVQAMLEEGDEAEWFEQCDTDADFLCVPERTITDVQFIPEEG